MANLRVLKRRIKSIGGIRQITRAMEMVSATQLKRALKRIENARPYFDRMDEIIAHLMASIELDDTNDLLHPLMKPGVEGGSILLVVIASDKGLCSSYNSNIIRKTNQFIKDELSDEPSFRFDPSGGEINATLIDPDGERIAFKGNVDTKGVVKSLDSNDPVIEKSGQYNIEYTYNPPEGQEISGTYSFSTRMDSSSGMPRRLWSYADELELLAFGTLKLSIILSEINQTGKKIYMLPIGKKIFNAFSKDTNPQVKMLEPEIDFDQSLPTSQLNRMTNKLARLYTLEHVSRVCLLYTQYQSVARQKPILEQFLPLGETGEKDNEYKEQTSAMNREYIFEPSPMDLFMNLIPAFARSKIFQALAHSYSSEHTIRMTAMRNATDNAGDLIDELTLKRNKARQAVITTELGEIVSGAEALKG